LGGGRAEGSVTMGEIRLDDDDAPSTAQAGA